ncbi:hypothetical protein HPB51_007739 [Rhipicephalus microplus]|uniref:Uncharacterized protein n=1 Tax=Rhipicephalus microplus TaxID=6941 RepID=A0A9J6ER35_RHIMP|nr:hypothetical protein HPB51_007739 [Rhipicephalus microplus]
MRRRPSTSLGSQPPVFPTPAYVLGLLRRTRRACLQLTAEGFREKLRTCKLIENETGQQFPADTSTYFDRWLEMGKCDLKTVAELAEHADRYLKAEGQKNFGKEKEEKEKKEQTRIVSECFSVTKQDTELEVVSWVVCADLRCSASAVDVVDIQQKAGEAGQQTRQLALLRTRVQCVVTAPRGFRKRTRTRHMLSQRQYSPDLETVLCQWRKESCSDEQ